MKNWIPVDTLGKKDFLEYLETLPESERSEELVKFSQKEAIHILKKEMKDSKTNFYNFISKFSPADFKIINRKSHVSQRVIVKHVKYWNEVNPTKKVKTLRVFLY
jgi:hypothetical protein